MNASKENQKIIEELIVTSNVALFESYGVNLVHVTNAAPDEAWEESLELAGLIGYTSPELRGSLVIAAGAKPLAGLGEASAHRDWIQELANQLLGRVKNRLLAFGVEVQMTTPLSLRGMHLTLEPNHMESRPLLFRTPEGGAVCVLMDAELQPGFTLERDESAENACPNEGDLLLF